MLVVYLYQHSLSNTRFINMSHIRWFQLGYCTHKLQNDILEIIAESNEPVASDVLEALEILKCIKNEVESQNLSLFDVFTLWNKAHDLFTQKNPESSDDESNDSM